MILYFDCNFGISGDMSVGALLDLGADRSKLEKAFSSMNLDNEFEYNIAKKPVNSIMATDFEVIIPNNPHNHTHRNLEDVRKIIEKADIKENAKNLAYKIFEIVANAEAKVHGKKINEVHFHEVGAIDSIADIVGFCVLLDDLAPEKCLFSTLTDGQGFVCCAHGKMGVPVPAVCEIAAEYKLPLKISSNQGEMVTPTGAAIAAALYTGESLPDEIIIEKIGYGSGKRPYENPVLRVLQIK